MLLCENNANLPIKNAAVRFFLTVINMTSRLVILVSLLAFLVEKGYSLSLYNISCLNCPENEELVRHDLCCEPTCSDECSDGSCRYYPSGVPSCVCKTGYVRYRGRCIRRKQCPRQCPCRTEKQCCCETQTTAPPCNVTPDPPTTTLAPCTTTPAPTTTTPVPCTTTPAPDTTTPDPSPCVTTPPPAEIANIPSVTSPPPCPCNVTCDSCECEVPFILVEERIPEVKYCPPHSTYQSCTPCCQRTCGQDCSTVRCISGCSGEPTCVCDEGYVKYNRRCIPKSFCTFEKFSYI